MCLIVSIPADRVRALPKKSDALFTSGIFGNPDGWGIQLADGTRCKAWRGFGADSFTKAFRKAQKMGHAIDVHFRYATHGPKDAANCHPFIFREKGMYCLMHNGIISSAPKVNDAKSDTWHFANYVMRPLLAMTPALFGSRELADVVESMVGSGNKIVLLRADGERQFFNKEEGTEWEGLWLSNDHHTPGRLDKWAYRSAMPAKGRDLDFMDDSDTIGPWRDYELADSPTAKVGAPNVRAKRSEDDWDLYDLAAMQRDDIIDVCGNSPDFVADLIENYFAWSSSRRLGY